MTPKLHFNQQHAMLLYPVADEEDAIARYVNEALKRDSLTVYLPLTKIIIIITMHHTCPK